MSNPCLDDPYMNDYLYECATQNYCMYVQQRNASPMPWVGLYIAVASFVCFLAMMADTICGIHSKRLWFPCRYFRLNAASLTLLALAGKLTVDLNTTLWGIHDKVAKLSSLVLINTALGCFMPSLGSMDNREILANVTALGIFVITVIVNIWLHLFTDAVEYQLGYELISGMVFLICLFLSLVSSSLSIPAIKKYIEAKYQEMHNVVSNEEGEERGKSSIKNLRSLIKRHWVMAATGNPQFVMARTATCVMSGFVCLLSAIILAEAEIRMRKIHRGLKLENSDYKWSIILILVIQSLGVAAGTIPPTSRWFISLSFKSSETGSKDYKNMLRTETFWTQRLEEWRESSLSLPIRNTKCRKLLQNIKYVILCSCIKFQILIVVSSKVLLLFHVVSLSLLLQFLNHVRRFYLKHKSESYSQTNQSGQSEAGEYLDLSQYVLLLEGEARLPKKILRNICTEVDLLILAGKKKQPKNLIKLLQGASSFNCVVDFDDDRIPSLHSQEPRNCWSLPIVTLTSIALALFKTNNHIADHFLKSVNEGLPYVNLVQKCQDTGRNCANSVQNAADILWVGVELYYKWLDEDLRNLEGSTCKEILQGLAKTAERIFMEFKIKTDGLKKNPIRYWPVRVIAANSMYRLSKTILLNYEEGKHIADEQLFEKLKITISDIFASCFTNLPRLITLKSRCDAIEERERSAGEAAVLFGETENVLEIVEQLQLSGMVPDQVACIHDWRAWVKQRNANAAASVSTSTT